VPRVHGTAGGTSPTPRGRFDLHTLSYGDFLEGSLEALLSSSGTLMIAISGIPAQFG
jgi:hypothetical protein